MGILLCWMLLLATADCPSSQAWHCALSPTCLCSRCRGGHRLQDSTNIVLGRIATPSCPVWLAAICALQNARWAEHACQDPLGCQPSGLQDATSLRKQLCMDASGMAEKEKRKFGWKGSQDEWGNVRPPNSASGTDFHPGSSATHHPG